MAVVAPVGKYAEHDLSNHLAHFTWPKGKLDRAGDKGVPELPSHRLASILHERRVRAFETFATPLPVACFSEAVPRALRYLIGKEEPHFGPWGIVFTRQFVWDAGGGPVWYVRGDEWEQARARAEPTQLSRMVRYDPGVEYEDPDSGVRVRAGRSEWIHEREWRVVGRDFTFTWDDVAYLIVAANSGGLPFLDRHYRDQYGLSESVGASFLHRHVAVDDHGASQSDPAGFWAEPPPPPL